MDGQEFCDLRSFFDGDVRRFRPCGYGPRCSDPAGCSRPLGIVLPDQPRAVAVLFAGGSGTLWISEAGHIGRPGNALIRGRSHFADRGLVTVAIDAPSDQLTAYGKMSD